MGCLIAFRLCCSRVLALAVALLALSVVHGWCTCSSVNYTSGSLPAVGACNSGSGCGSGMCSFAASASALCTFDCSVFSSGGYYYTNGSVNDVSRTGGSSSYYCKTGYYDQNYCFGSVGSWSVRCLYKLRCDNKLQADSVACGNRGDIWNSITQHCDKNCKSRFCCDSVAQNMPVETDTTWEGCVATSISDRCLVYSTSVTPGDTTVGATCNGKSRYRVCTKQYMWSESAKQCSQILTGNCVNLDVTDDKCTDVKCYATQQHSLSSLDYNHLTKCYTGTETIQKILICNNGVREDGGNYTRPFMVCQPYLDSLGIDISDYISGKSGYSGSGYSAGGGASGEGGGGGSDPGYGGCVGNGCGTEDGMPPGYQGGPGKDAQGNDVVNSPSPGIGGQYTPTPQIVTEYDSTTGETHIVKNKSGGDSVIVKDVFTKIRCLGVANGVATLTNGLNTWTCEAMTCSQATLSASINQGACSPLANGITHSETNPSMPTINYGDDATSSVDMMFGNYEAIYGPIVSTLNSNYLDEKRHQDSISAARDRYWKVTFGDDLSYIESIKNSAESAASSLSLGFENTILAVSNGADRIVTAVQNASTSVSAAVGNAASDVSGSVSAGATKVANAVNSASSNVSAVVGNAATSVTGSVDNMKSALRDTLHRANQIADGIYTAVSDTGRNIPTVIKSIEGELGDLPSRLDSVFTVDMESWSNDKLKIMMDSNTVKVVDALDNLNVDVQLDSIHVEVPHDTVLDSIAHSLKTGAEIAMEFANDTLDLSDAFKQGYDSVKADTSYDFDSSGLFPSHLFFVDGSAIQDTNSFADEAASVAAKFDSSRTAMNNESDSTVKAHADSAMKYSGIEKGGNAMKQLFNRGADGCPRHCLDLSIQNPFGKSAKPVSIPFSTWLCDRKIFGQLSALDFIKHIMRLMTSMLSVMLIWSVFGKKGQK